MKPLFDFSTLATEHEIENDELRKEIYLKYFNWFAAGFTLFYTAVCFFIQYKAGVFITLGVFLSFVLIGVVPKSNFSLLFRSNWFVLTGGVDIYFNALLTGGIHSPVAAWHVFLPLLPLILSRFNNAMVWMFVSVALVTSLYMFDVLNLTPPMLKEVEENMSVFQFAVFVGLMVLVFFIASLFDSLKNIALTTLDNRNKELDKARHELIEAQKYKDRFIATVSHELRTPMNAILGVTDILQNGETDKLRFELLDGMKRSADNLLLLINDILDLSRIQAGKTQITTKDFRFTVAVKSVVNLYTHHAHEKGIQLVVNIDSNVPEVLNGDERRVSQLLTNLIGNAIKFTTAGKVTVSIACASSQPGACDIAITVTDTGIGIAPDKLTRIFESFEQVDENISRSYGGTGLGLAITKQVTELLGGDIFVESELGRGSVFKINVPFKNAASQAVEEQSGFDYTMAEKLKGIKVLLAEDSNINRLITRRQMELLVQNIQFDFACDGDEALQKISSNYYDIVLMDVRMPGLTGLEVTKEVRKQKNPVKIIAMTASVLNNEVQDCYDAGMNEFVAKPFDKHELVRKIYQQVHGS